MARNDVLRRAIVAAGITVADFAERCDRERIEATPLTLATRIAMTRAEVGNADAAIPVRLPDRHIAMSV